MALRSLKSRLRTLDARVAIQSREDAEAHRLRERDQNVGWRKWYKTARWQRLRMVILIRDLFTCQMPGCGKIESNTSLLVCDHKTPHRGDEAMFWNENNLQCLCKACHDSLKQKEERARPGW